MNAYQQRYGIDRAERARRMSDNEPPEGLLPQPDDIEFENAPAAHFTMQYMYVEDVWQLTPVERTNRSFVAVRSQKSNYGAEVNEVYPIVDQLVYFVQLADNIPNLQYALYIGPLSVIHCTCEDHVQRQLVCKHILAVRRRLTRDMNRAAMMPTPPGLNFSLKF